MGSQSLSLCKPQTTDVATIQQLPSSVTPLHMHLPTLLRPSDVVTPSHHTGVVSLSVRLNVDRQRVLGLETLLAERALVGFAVHVAKADMMEETRWAIAC